MSAALGELARRVGMSTTPIVAIYFCGYTLAYDDRMFLLPVTAFVSRPTDILTQGIPAQSVVDLARRGARVSLTAFDIYDRATIGKPGAASPATRSARSSKRKHRCPVTWCLPRRRARGARPRRRSRNRSRRHSETHRSNSAVSWRICNEYCPVPESRSMQRTTATGHPRDACPAGSRLRQRSERLAAFPCRFGANATESPPMPEEDQYNVLDRRRIQAALRQLGYYVGEVDGVIGPDTRAAIRRYQHELRAPMTGRLTAEQATRLVSGLSQPSG